MNGQSPWERPETVRGFVQSAPNSTLLRYAAQQRAAAASPGRALDLGCGAGRNAIPLAQSGWDVVGVDTSVPMLAAARERLDAITDKTSLTLVRATMADLPFANQTFELIIAHGVWNLAKSDTELRAAMGEAARVARPGAALFVFTFSRHTLPPETQPLTGETFVFDAFSGEPQCFLTADQLVTELAAAGFQPDSAVPLTEHNRSAARLLAPSGPVIYEGAFRYAAAG